MRHTTRLRTGGEASGVPIRGQGNCHGWTDHDYASSGGTVVWLQTPWPLDITSVWGAGVAVCAESFQVWCVQD